MEECLLSKSIQILVSRKALAFLTRLDAGELALLIFPHGLCNSVVITACDRYDNLHVLIHSVIENLRILAMPVIETSVKCITLTMNLVHLLWATDVATFDMFSGKPFVLHIMQGCPDDGHEFAPLRASVISAASAVPVTKFAKTQQAMLEAQIIVAAQGLEDLPLACKLHATYFIRHFLKALC